MVNGVKGWALFFVYFLFCFIPKLAYNGMVVGWSRDNTSFFVFGWDDHDRLRTYLWNSASGALKPVGPDGFTDRLSMVSPDRQRMLVMAGDGRLWTYPTDGSEGRLVPGLSEHDIPRGWRADSASFYISTHRDTSSTPPLSILDITTGIEQ
jgi:hypothetical protein